MVEPWTVVEIANDHGLRARLTDHGARLLELWTPDRDGSLDDIVLGFSTLEEYRSRRSLFVGCTIGRVANRIRDARFSLDDREYLLSVNEPPNHLHGGFVGFDDRPWAIEATTAASVTFGLVSPHLEEGYPGQVRARVSYSVSDHDELVVDFLAEPDRPTPISLTHHSYWNLGGHRAFRDALGHGLWVDASRYLPSGASLVPTGDIAPLAASALDFRSTRPIGERIAELATTPTRGYDHSLVLDRHDRADGETCLAARLRDPVSGRSMELSTTELALQVYSGQTIPEVVGKHGARYGPFAGIALEAQGYPDAVNEPGFPSVVVSPEAPYRQRSVYRFSAD